MFFTMKSVAIILTIWFVVGTSEAGPLKQLKAQISESAKEGRALMQKQADADPNAPWVKLNVNPVCFGGRGSHFGAFTSSQGGNLMKIKLVHLYGYINCLGDKSEFWSYWGCGYYVHRGVADWTVISVTDGANTELFPPSQINRGSLHWALIPGYSSRSPELVMSIYETPVFVTAGEQLRVWYSEDLFNEAEENNHGRVCADVYGYFM